MNNFQFGITTGMIIIFALVIYFIHSFRRQFKKNDNMMNDLFKKLGGEEDNK